MSLVMVILLKQDGVHFGGIYLCFFWFLFLFIIEIFRDEGSVVIFWMLFTCELCYHNLKCPACVRIRF